MIRYIRANIHDLAYTSDYISMICSTNGSTGGSMLLVRWTFHGSSKREIRESANFSGNVELAEHGNVFFTDRNDEFGCAGLDFRGSTAKIVRTKIIY